VKEIDNGFIAERLREAASLLEQQGANRYRVNAYRKAAAMLDSFPRSAALLLQTEGIQGLTSLPSIGPVIGAAIAEMVRTGQWSQLERLRGALDPEALFSKVPGVGPALARHIIDELHIDTLEALANAAHDGQLKKVPGFGVRRLAMVRSALAEMLGRGRWRSRTRRMEPPVDVLLAVDKEYREKAEADQLHRIAPKRFNPDNVAWLPVLHTERDSWQLTALYSNTALAHELGRNRDWVVIYFHSDSHVEDQRTVVTETQGPLKGRRVVRGRESECADYYSPVLFQPTSVA
jgi:putative hydrolase